VRASLTERVEQLWLRALPTLARNYLWVSVGGFRIYGSAQHQFALYWLVKGYERFTRRLFRGALEPGMRVLDIGAHIGWYTLIAARGVGPTGQVYAFEPDPENFRLLRHNIALNGLGSIVATIPKAAADIAGVRTFYSDAKGSLRSSLWSDGRESEAPITVECATVDEIVGHEAIGVVKLDVEGAEVHALRGMRETLAASPRVVLFVECNPSALASAGTSATELIEELRGAQLDVQVIDDKRRCLTNSLEELTRPEAAGRKFYANLYCTRGHRA
jgi:FkbM family methyltransferase